MGSREREASRGNGRREGPSRTLFGMPFCRRETPSQALTREVRARVNKSLVPPLLFVNSRAVDGSTHPLTTASFSSLSDASPTASPRFRVTGCSSRNRRLVVIDGEDLIPSPYPQTRPTRKYPGLISCCTIRTSLSVRNLHHQSEPSAQRAWDARIRPGYSSTRL